MQRSDLADLTVFAAIARNGSFRRAALELGVSTSALSHALRGLETRMGVRLLHRTTRSVAPTEAGAALLTRIGPALAEIAEAVGAAGAFRATLGGALRINAPRSACRFVLMPLVARYLARHPAVRVEVVADDAMTDVVAGGFDAGVRFGEHLAGDMIAVALGGAQRFAVVGSPDYLAGRSHPEGPDDLGRHLCIRQRFPGGAIYRWELEKEGRAVAVSVDGPLIVNDQEMIVQAALAGLGLGLVFEESVVEHLASGRLVRLMPDWCPSFPGLFLYYAGRRQIPPPLQAFIDLVRRPEPDLTAIP
ncbi:MULTISPECIES: LysR family transcriptional regulator [unclassified Methylobacterium]|uniref:LysR family transcriptional regulator n=1 Tax=unclassified Methylobacterium TaxID=2615210 RepID=UPI0006F5E4D9|nr:MULTISPECIES: LysR family transcriptional regulator [unclassified Methylobacterium]KQP73359.1 transcriptional regulator [Methylobacterium sp. Leaf113]MCK2053995.1 LysR family transcriptional regulator [Methylobacterium sp. 37f]